MSVQIERHLFNVAEYHRMAEAGILSKDDRVELINGEIIEMSPVGSRHQACVDRLTSHLVQQSGSSAIVRVQGPIRMSNDSEPQSDIVLLKPRADFYSQSHPIPDDALLVIEIADTSYDYDRYVKVPTYAETGISEVWLVYLMGDFIEVYSQPENEMYKECVRFERGDFLTPLKLAHIRLNVDSILG